MTHSAELSRGSIFTRINPVWLLFLGALALMAVWLGIKSYRIYRAADSLLGYQSQAEAMMAQGLDRLDGDALEEMVFDMRRDVLTLQHETALFMPLAPALSWLPKVGSTVAVAPQLMAMADAGTEAAAYGIRGMKPAIDLMGQKEPAPDSSLSSLLTAVAGAGPDLVQVGLSLERLAEARHALGDTSALPWRLQSLLGTLDAALPLAQDGLKFTGVLPQMAGLSGPRRYLLVAQNQDELRPTGGFLSGAGILVLEEGRIVDLSFQDAYGVDNFRDKPYAFPPQPLYDLMGLEMFLFRDANFWADFPYSAEIMMDLYAYGQDLPPLDGAIAVDQRFIQMLLEATGPVNLLDAGALVGSDSVLDFFQQAWTFQGDPESTEWREWFDNRKSFIGIFANALRAKIETELSEVDPLLLGQNVIAAIESKHLQIYMRDAAVQSVLAELGWDSRVAGSPGADLLMAVDSNLGYSKANLLVDRSWRYDVTLDEAGTGVATTAVSYHHRGTADGEPCIQGVSYALENVTTYNSVSYKCYWPYLRLYTPKGSQLLASSRHQVAAETMVSGLGWDREAQLVNDLPWLTVFDNFLEVPKGETVSITMRYRLPTVTTASADGSRSYQLNILKQAGTRAEDVSVTVKLPAGAELVSASPEPAASGPDGIRFDVVLETDTVITISYR